MKWNPLYHCISSCLQRRTSRCLPWWKLHSNPYKLILEYFLGKDIWDEESTISKLNNLSSQSKRLIKLIFYQPKCFLDFESPKNNSCNMLKRMTNNSYNTFERQVILRCNYSVFTASYVNLNKHHLPCIFYTAIILFYCILL